MTPNTRHARRGRGATTPSGALSAALTLALALAACSGGAGPGDAASESAAGADAGRDAVTANDAELDAELDAGAPDVAVEDAAVEDAATDEGPPRDAPRDGPTCTDPGAEPNESEVLAMSLGMLSDCDSSGMTVSGVSAGRSDVDFFRYAGSDRFGCTVNPTARIDARALRVCMFIACTGGPTTLRNCAQGTRATSPAGLGGCCATGGTVEAEIDCPGASDDANVYLRVDQPAGDACVPYRVTYHY